MDKDTIVAIATAAGQGGIGIVRLSGPDVKNIAEKMLGLIPSPRQAGFHRFKDSSGVVIDNGIALFFPTPHSFTGEDVLELQGHGGPVVLDLLVQAAITSGARLARPGEFSERAFLNNKIDLAQAEAIADLIESQSSQAARSALRSLQGVFSERVHALVEQLTTIRVSVEAIIDFSDEEDIDPMSEDSIIAGLVEVGDKLEHLMASARNGVALRDGLRVVIIGKPNAGKSSLLNRLSEKDRAIVSDQPGTTRDVLHETVTIDGIPLHIVDTAGLRDQADVIEQEGISRAWSEVEQADLVLMMVDDQDGITEQDNSIIKSCPADRRLTIVFNKIDLTKRASGAGVIQTHDTIAVSVKSGEGMVNLYDHLKQCAGISNGGEGDFIARRRHIDALQRARQHLESGLRQFTDHAALELLAEELRHSQQALSEISGEFTSDDLLGRIFSSFCIGK